MKAKLIGADGAQIRSARDNVQAISVPFMSARHVMEVGTGLYTVYKNLQDSPVKTILGEALDDIGSALERFQLNGGVIEALPEEVQQVSNLSPVNLLDL